jgi:hypothetical protein
MITEEQATSFANDWIDSWNAHDLDRIMSHYDQDVEYFSMFLAKLTDNKAGMLQGKDNVKEYLSKGLSAYPDLHFKLLNIFVGVASVVLHYQSVNNLIAAEVFELNTQGLASRVQCHYYQA